MHLPRIRRRIHYVFSSVSTASQRIRPLRAVVRADGGGIVPVVCWQFTRAASRAPETRIVCEILHNQRVADERVVHRVLADHVHGLATIGQNPGGLPDDLPHVVDVPDQDSLIPPEQFWLRISLG